MVNLFYHNSKPPCKWNLARGELNMSEIEKMRRYIERTKFLKNLLTLLSVQYILFVRIIKEVY